MKVEIFLMVAIILASLTVGTVSAEEKITEVGVITSLPSGDFILVGLPTCMYSDGQYRLGPKQYNLGAKSNQVDFKAYLGKQVSVTGEVKEPPYDGGPVPVAPLDCGPSRDAPCSDDRLLKAGRVLVVESIKLLNTIVGLPLCDGDDKSNETGVAKTENKVIQKDGTNLPVSRFDDDQVKRTYIVSSDPEKCQPVPCQSASTDVKKDQFVIGDGGAEAKTSLEIRLNDGKLMAMISQGQEEPVILPSEAKEAVLSRLEEQKSQKVVVIGAVELKKCDSSSVCSQTQSIYTVEAKTRHKLLGLIPVQTNTEYKISAKDGQVISENKPWYLRFLPFLFPFRR